MFFICFFFLFFFICLSTTFWLAVPTYWSECHQTWCSASSGWALPLYSIASTAQSQIARQSKVRLRLLCQTYLTDCHQILCGTSSRWALSLCDRHLIVRGLIARKIAIAPKSQIVQKTYLAPYLQVGHTYQTVTNCAHISCTTTNAQMCKKMHNMQKPPICAKKLFGRFYSNLRQKVHNSAKNTQLRKSRQFVEIKLR